MPWTKIETEEMERDGGNGATPGGRLLSYSEAIREALDQAMGRDPSVFVMGQGVDDPMGMFGTTLGLQEKYGWERVFDTPLAENGLTGIAIGAALGGLRPVYLHNRPDFLLLAMDQIVNHASKWSYMFGGAVKVPLVIWACIGRGWGSAAQHSQALQGLFLHVPGLKLVMPSSCHDAKGLMLSAIADDNPVLIIEHRFNLRVRGPVPEDPYLVPLGKAAVRRSGSDLTIAAASWMVSEACLAADELAREGIQAEVLDLRTLCPLDRDTILGSVRKTGRLVVADTGWKTGGLSAEIASLAVEEALSCLKAPVHRIACPDLPTPAGFTLEQAYYPGKREIADAGRGAMGEKGCGGG